MSRRPRESATPLRAKLETPKKIRAPTTSIIKVEKNARFCPAGHCFQNIALTHRQQQVQEEQQLPAGELPPISCDGCGIDIHDKYISGSCKVCDIDFCEDCFHSGTPIEDLLEDGMESDLDATLSLSMSEMTMSVTEEKCSRRHPLCRVVTRRRMKYLQERDNLPVPPTIECDCCSKVIKTEFIAGCCVACDVDFCEECSQSGQSFEDMLQEPIPVDDEEPEMAFGERYNGKRPSYKGSGRVSYDEYPDPTSFQWSFTGSCEEACVEFFEKDYGAKLGVVKLDFFYAKGKVKTVLHHLKKGERPLFTKGKRITSRLYRKILLDPRSQRETKSVKRKQVV